METLTLTPDAVEGRVIQGLIERGLATDAVAAARIALLIAGAAVGILEPGAYAAPGAPARTATPTDAATAAGGAPVEAGSVSASVAALGNLLRKGRPRAPT